MEKSRALIMTGGNVYMTSTQPLANCLALILAALCFPAFGVKETGIIHGDIFL